MRDRPVLFNPEFRRNIWVEFSWRRLLAMPLFLALLFLGAHAVGGWGMVDRVALGALIALVVIWGTRQAAAAVADEMRAGTWDAQRMSALGPWTMAWGKLLGATAYTWYGAALCVAVMLACGETARGEILNMLLTALTAQAAALYLGLLFGRDSRREARRGGVGAAQGLAIATALWLGTQDWYWSSGDVRWWRMTLDARVFMLASQGLALAWTLAGIQALMRAELRYPPEPWTWLAFLAFAGVYCAGFADALTVTVWLDSMVAAQAVPLLVAMACISALTLIAALASTNCSVSLRRWLAAPTRARARPAGLLTEAPGWGLGLAATLAVAITVTAIWWRVPSPPWLWVLVWSGVLFLLRDLGLVLALTLDSGLRRGPLGAVLVLLALYMLGPVVLDQHLPALTAALRPTWGATVAGTLLPALAQALAAWGLVAVRWRASGTGQGRRSGGRRSGGG